MSTDGDMRNDDGREEGGMLRVGRVPRPMGVTVVGWLIVAGGAITAVEGVMMLASTLQWGLGEMDFAGAALMATAGATALVSCGLGAALLRGINWARYVFAATAVVGAIAGVIILGGGAMGIALSLSSLVVPFCMLYFLFQPESNAFFASGPAPAPPPAAPEGEAEEAPKQSRTPFADSLCIVWLAVCSVVVVVCLPVLLAALKQSIGQGMAPEGPFILGMLALTPSVPALAIAFVLRSRARGLGRVLRNLVLVPPLVPIAITLLAGVAAGFHGR